MLGYIIHIENNAHKQWSVDKVFTDFSKAQSYLYSKGFSYNSGFYIKDSNWSDKQKAYIGNVIID